jgi:hypothetical protein
MSCNKVILDPLYEVVLEDTFNQLVEQVRGEKFMNIGARKIMSKRLSNGGYNYIPKTILQSEIPRHCPAIP